MRQNARFRSSWEPGGDLITLTVRVAGVCHCSQLTASSPDIAGLRRLISFGSTINLKVRHWGSLNSIPLQYSMVLSWIPDSGKSGMAVGMDPRSPANRGWRWGWTPDPRQIGDGTAIPDPRQIGDGGGDGDRGFRALPGDSTIMMAPRASHCTARGISVRAECAAHAYCSSKYCGSDMHLPSAAGQPPASPARLRG